MFQIQSSLLVHSMKARKSESDLPELDGAAKDQCYLRQGCCIATVLFNLYTCLVVECWHHMIHVAEGIGVTVRYKYDKL